MSKNTNAKPYDSAFKTVMMECRSIIYPLLNETFGESYDSSDVVEFLNEEHEDSTDAEEPQKLISDTNFIVRDRDGNICGRYVYDCQSTADGTMVVRMFRYGSRAAFENSYFDENGFLHIPFPRIAALYLRGTGKDMVESSVIKVDYPGKTVDYEVKLLQFRQYSVDELFEKKLYVLLPFVMFLYEGQLEELNDNNKKLSHLLTELRRIIRRLDQAAEEGNLTRYQGQAITELLRSVSDKLARKYSNVKEGVEDLMGGQLMELQVTKVWKEGLEKGRAEGLDEGRAQGLNEGRAEGLDQGRAEMVKNSLKYGNSVEQTALILGLSVEEVERLSKL